MAQSYRLEWPSPHASGPSNADTVRQSSLWPPWFRTDKDSGDKGHLPLRPAPPAVKTLGHDDKARLGLVRRISRNVVPRLPRAQTFKRQQSELRNKLEATKPTPAERRTVSVDRRGHHECHHHHHHTWQQAHANPPASAPGFLQQHDLLHGRDPPSASLIKSLSSSALPDTMGCCGSAEVAASVDEAPSVTTSEYDAMIRVELEVTWILNLSMHFRDKSKREKFFVTYRPPERPGTWRRVTISLDYRDPPEDSLESELARTPFQRDKMAKIYEAIRDSLHDIRFYDTVTNLKLQTSEGRLHVHVVEDVNEIIVFPTVRMIQHRQCKQVKEKDFEFEAHMSGFVFKVKVGGQVLIKKEIPGPETVDEFLYEINALNRLTRSRNVIALVGLVVDDGEQYVKGLLLSLAEKGALMDVLYRHGHTLSWVQREKWARQIVAGLSEIHEAGFVQGDFTLSNIVVDASDNAKIIDINRRGCPMGWEPPEATPLIESGQHISMYIGVKSDLYQLGMVLWSLATQEDDPEQRSRPLQIDADMDVPAWYRYIVDMCLSEDPSDRKHASSLLSVFPKAEASRDAHDSTPLWGDPGNRSIIKTVQPSVDWSCVGWDRDSMAEDVCYYYPPRGRSPPSPQPSSHGDVARYRRRRISSWSDHCLEATTMMPKVGDAAQGNAATVDRATQT